MNIFKIMLIQYGYTKMRCGNTSKQTKMKGNCLAHYGFAVTTQHPPVKKLVTAQIAPYLFEYKEKTRSLLL